MAALNNNLPLISCLLTDLGKQVISDTPSNFKITKFSVTDDEIDYANLSYNSLSGMQYLYFFSDTGYLREASNCYSASTNIFSGLTDVTFSFWIKILENSISGIEVPIISWGSGITNRIAISLRHKKIEIICAAGTNTYVQTNDNILSPDTWTNFIVKYDLSQVSNTDRIKIYKNGTLLTSLTFSGTIPSSIVSLTSQIVFGNFPYNAFNNTYQTFLLKNMLCYNGLIDNSEISSITSNGVNTNSYPQNRSGLTAIGIWNLNGESNNFEKDVSANKFDLTFNSIYSPYIGKVSDLNQIISDSNASIINLNNYITILPKNTNRIFNIELDKDEIIITNIDSGSCTISTKETIEELGYTIYINTNNIDISPSNQVYRLIDAELKRIEIENKLKQIDEIELKKKFVTLKKTINVKTITCKDTFQIMGKGIIGIYNITIVGNSSGAIKKLRIKVKL